MNPFRPPDAEEMARLFNQDEEISCRYQEKRARRARFRTCPLTETELDQLDWLTAEAEVRQTRCVGVEVR